MTRKKAAAILTKLLEQVRTLQSTYDAHEFMKWERSVPAAIASIFGEDSFHLRDVQKVKYSPMLFTAGTPDRVFEESKQAGMGHMEAILESMIEEIADYWEDALDENAQTGDDKEVFLVHGHDNEAKETVARFLVQLDLQPVILHERPNMGRTVIEKLEANSEVGFAIVLLTADDLGSSKRTPEDMLPRARQNVVMELGLFMGLLGRKRVCALLQDGVELPSDYRGVVYIPYGPSESWKLQMVRELHAAGFAVDANKAL